MVKYVDDLVDMVDVMHRTGEIESRAYLRLTGELLAFKKVIRDLHVDDAILLLDTAKVVLNA